MEKKRVVIGFLGTTLDAGKQNRWGRWRPTVELCQYRDLPIGRLDMIHGEGSMALAERVTADIAQVSPATEVRRHLMNLADPWDFEEVYGALHDFARGYPFDPDAEDYLVNITTGTHVAQICWFLLIEAHFIPAKILQLSPPRGGRDGGERQPSSYGLIDIDLSRYDRIATRFRRDRDEAANFLKSGIETRNEAFNRMIDRIEQVAIRSKAPLLLCGPTGAGKSQLARRIYELKKARRQVGGPFVEVNCATLRGDGAASALFGHVRGAFTGAASERAGLLRAADKGILFLDEIGELGPDEQAMALRAIEEKRFLPVGSDKEVGSDFQLIAGTNRDLSLDVRAGRFREDLLARLNLWTFDLPGLADRPEDIEPNLDFELARFSEREGLHVTINREARQRYLAFAASPAARWLANFRDLGASVTRMATLAPRGRIDAATVDEELARLRRAWASKADDDRDLLADLFGESELDGIDLFDRVQLVEVVKVCRREPTASAAGRALFAASRAKKASANDADRLRKYLGRFGLDWTAVRERGA
ncbi:transcriptional regulatory protein RtcR [Methylopila capsulata]|uniref:Transcriptional regulator n=1 Tax=Methylopila capsulata TaxID=61654 RepID=A0A9W6MTI4_9HYPH|nr:RNA repair transcriptional activator RtcR [Methylopila capsulata]MBM7853503.1 transcriptional regulatory protein RtcR [Methylopila capsulata]GLK57282.1 transcriptional regulator [Methylopila capsulata]